MIFQKWWTTKLAHLVCNSGKVCLLVAGIASLTACGGGGGGGGSKSFVAQSSSSSSAVFDGWKSGVFASQDAYANQCASPRSGIDPSTNSVYPDTQGTAADENNFLRSWSNDSYLWYSEIVDRDPFLYADPLSYFDLLKTTAKTASGKNKDNFHFTYDSSVWYSLSTQGKEGGYGMELSWVASAPPRNVIVAYTDAGTPAALQGVTRGSKITKIDGVDFISTGDQTSVDTFNAALFPAAGETHTFEFQNINTNATYSVTMQAAIITQEPVQHANVIDTPSGKVGYLAFHAHIDSAVQPLITAFTQFQNAGVKDLVLDLRYNGGGALYIADEVGYMIAGATATAGKVFEKLTMNDKYGVISTTHFGEDDSGNPVSLPSLNLSRVFVITTGNTCSASESIINSLRGIGVEVIQIGSKTCGKPYGFFPQDNCGTTYFTIQFKGTNEKGFGEYADGFSPGNQDNGTDVIKGCTLGDDLTHELGDSNENNLAAALNYRTGGSCTSPSAMGSFKLQKPADENDYSNVQGDLRRAPAFTNRFVKHP